MTHHAGDSHASFLRDVNVSRALDGKGFHLTLQTAASFRLASAAPRCTRWAAIERLPPGAHFDPHQLKRLGRRDGLGGAAAALVLGEESTLEAPAEASADAVVLVHGVLGDAARDVGDNLGQQPQSAQILDDVARLGGDEQ